VFTQGRQAGKKAVVVKVFDEGTKARPFGHALVMGVEKAPLPVTKRMSQRKTVKRQRVKPFVQYVNFNHIIPTRYTLPSESFDCKTWVSEQQMETPEGRTTAKMAFKTLLKDKFKTMPADKSGKPLKDLAFLKTKLRF
jgi:large subunit ribosomal protein L27e